MDHFPESLPYFPKLPTHMRQRVFSFLKEPLPEVSPGKVLLRPLFEKLVSQILSQDFTAGSGCPISPVRMSLRCTSVVDIINMCKFSFLSGIFEKKILKDPVIVVCERSFRTVYNLCFKVQF